MKKKYFESLNRQIKFLYRALTQTEIARIYNAQKRLFGL